MVNFLWYNLYLYEFWLVKNSDKGLLKGLFYMSTGVVMIWFIKDVYKGFENPRHKETVIIYFTSIAGLFLLFGLSYLYIIKDHPWVYFILFNGTTWNFSLFNLLNGLRLKILNHENK